MTDSATSQESRGRVLSAIETAPEPVTVDAIAHATGLHANTIRGHLDVLIAAGSVSRESADHRGRGRPRWLYRPAAPVQSPYQALAEALSLQLTQVGDPSMAGRAAEVWAQALPDLPSVDTPDEAVAEAAAALERLGFESLASPVGDSIVVTGCPYAALVAENPVICDIHTALIGRLLAQTGQQVAIEAMDVWARPGMCVAHLRRPDLAAFRTITADEAGALTANEGRAS